MGLGRWLRRRLGMGVMPKRLLGTSNATSDVSELFRLGTLGFTGRRQACAAASARSLCPTSPISGGHAAPMRSSSKRRRVAQLPGAAQFEREERLNATRRPAGHARSCLPRLLLASVVLISPQESSDAKRSALGDGLAGVPRQLPPLAPPPATARYRPCTDGWFAPCQCSPCASLHGFMLQ